METVGIRGLKTHLSRHLKRVRSGARLVVTEHGRAIATISPIGAADSGWIHQLIAEGAAQWSGGKPTGSRNPVSLSGKRSAASIATSSRSSPRMLSVAPPAILQSGTHSGGLTASISPRSPKSRGARDRRTRNSRASTTGSMMRLEGWRECSAGGDEKPA